VGVVELLNQATGRIETELRGSPRVEAGVRYAIATTYAGMWEWAHAIPHLRIALDLNRRLYGDSSEKVADCLNLLGRALTFDRNAESIAMQREGLDIRRAVFGARHPAVAESIGNLGFAMWHGQATPDWTAAEKHYRESLAMYDGLDIENDPDVARFTFSLGVMLSVRQRYDEAEDQFKAALAIYDELPTTQDCYRARCMHAYASMLTACGRPDEAERLLRQLSEISPSELEFGRTPSVRPPRQGSGGDGLVADVPSHD
jgi:tetratricopeptide (TPR) repeat protein